MRAIEKKLRMAWFEYEGFGDGAVFTQTSTSRGVFENALSLLPRHPDGPRRRLATNLPRLDIRMRSHLQSGRRFRAFIGRPETRHAALLSETVLSLGVRGSELVDDAAPDEGIDLIVLSGHGNDGEVWGTNTGVDARTDIVRGIARGSNNSRSGKTKVLIVASCSNANSAIARFWLPAFNHESPLHLVLGYESGYAGGAIGARVLGRFADKLVRHPRRSMIDLWRAANEPNRQPWAAIAAKGSEGLTLEEWVEGTVAPLTNVTQLSHFSKTATKGVPVRLGNERFRLRWTMEDGTVITPETSGSSHPHIGLFSGKRGEIQIRANRRRDHFETGDEAYLLIYRYRPEKPIDTTKLLTFDESVRAPNSKTGKPVIKLDPRPRTDIQTSSSQRNAYLITVADDGPDIVLPFKLADDATDSFPADGPGGSHGRFMLFFLAPGQWALENTKIRVDTISVPVIGAHLRK